ncbi:MAG: metallophosphoesterase, partial [Oscillospiraceae bacterium]|nr:metallophosphoesterase [Oscillospiraceae bacterium]
MILKAVIPLAVGAAGWIVWDNLRLTVSRYEPKFAELPREFDGFTIVQASDLHNARFGKDQEKLIAAIRAEKPNLIAITGDLFHKAERDSAYTFLQRAAELAPC